MKIQLKEITIRDLTNGFEDLGESGVVGYNGKLDIRPAYQREFIYKDKQREAVIDTINKGFPLNVMYWAVNKGNKFEVIDGQQRTISISQYVNSDFAYKDMYFHNLSDDKRNKILNYKLFIYFCTGTQDQKLDWFETINIAGEKLTAQELRNAVYSGSWVADAKRYFSKTGCPAYQLAGRYLKGSAIRQDYLQTIIKWINNNNINDYMSKNQHNKNANDLWDYFNNVFNWVDKYFCHIQFRKAMIGVEWGFLYNEYKNEKLSPNKIEQEVHKLMSNIEVTNYSGVYPYILSRDERYLNIRAFVKNQKILVKEKQNHKCNKCNKYCETISDMEADHIIPWSKDGKTELANLQMLCINCNQEKSDNQ